MSLLYPSSYSPPSEALKKEQLQLAELFKEAFIEYFKHIDIDINSIDILTSDSSYSSRSYASLKLNTRLVLSADVQGSCTEEQFKHIKVLCYHFQEEKYPKLIKESLFASADISINDFSIFEYDTIIYFNMKFSFDSVDGLNKLFSEIKNKTEPLLRKKFEEEFDKELTNEIGE